MKACFMGLGYIDLPTAIIAASHGIEVIGVDINPQVVETINKGQIHIVEPGLQELCSRVIGGINEASTEKADIVVFLVAHNPFKTLPWREDKVILDFCSIFKRN